MKLTEEIAAKPSQRMDVLVKPASITRLLHTEYLVAHRFRLRGRE